MVKLESIMRENGLIDVLLKRSKTQRVMLFLLFLAIDIACFCLTVVSDYTIRSVFAWLSLVLACLAWHVVATVLPNRWKYYAANLVTVICLIAGTMGILTSPILKEKEQLICSSISPDGAYVASGYKYGDDEPFRAKVFVKNTEPMQNQEYQYVSQEVYETDSTQQLEIRWVDNTTLEVNGEIIDMDWLK